METLLYFVIGLPLVVIVLMAIALSTGGKKYLEEMGIRFWHWLLRTNPPKASQVKESDGGRKTSISGNRNINVSDSPGTSAVGRDQTVVHAEAGSTVIVGGSAGAGAGTAPAAAEQPSPAGVAPQLPDPVADFTGRRDQADQLIARLRNRQGAAITAIGGQGGVGKTELAYYVAREVRELYPGGQVLVNLRGLDANPIAPEQAMAVVILAVEPEQKLPDKPEQIAGLYHGLLAERAVLVLADNAKDSEQVRPLVPKSPSALLVTSRQTVQLAGVERVNLDELPRPESVALLREILGDKPAEDGQLDSLATLCGDLPLALRVAGDRLAASPSLSVGDYLKRVEEKRSELRFEERDVMAVLEDSIEALARDAPELVARWRSLTVFPAPFDQAAAEAVGQFEDGELDTLMGRSLVLYDAKDERFRLHDLMRDLARDGRGDEEAYNAAKRHAEHYLKVARRAQSAYLRDSEGVLEGLRLFDRERSHIEAGQAWAAGHAPSDDRVAALAAQDYPLVAAYVLDLRQHPRERIRWLEASARAAGKLGNKEQEGMALGNLGVAHRQLGEARRAIEYYEQCLAIAREAGDQRGEGAALGNLGLGYAALGEMRRAIQYYEQHLATARETGDRRSEGNALFNMSLALDKLGERAKAIEHARDALAIYEQIEDPNAGMVRRKLEEWGEEQRQGIRARTVDGAGAGPDAKPRSGALILAWGASPRRPNPPLGPYATCTPTCRLLGELYRWTTARGRSRFPAPHG